MKVTEMINLTCLIRDKITNTFIKDWKPLNGFFENRKNELVIYECTI